MLSVIANTRQVDAVLANYLLERGSTHFGHVVVMKKLDLAVVPFNLHA
jgi:hypothetical protein